MLPIRAISILALPQLFLLYLFLVSGYTAVIPQQINVEHIYVATRLRNATMISLNEMVQRKKENNAVIVTIATYAYRYFTVDFYHYSNLSAYNSFFVVTQDVPSFEVSYRRCDFILVLP